MSDSSDNLVESHLASYDRLRRMKTRWWIWSGVLALLVILPPLALVVTVMVELSNRRPRLHSPGDYFSSWFCLLAVPLLFTGLGWIAATFDLLDAFRRRRISLEMLGPDGRDR